MSAWIERIVAGVVDHVRAAVPDIEVEAWPDDPEGFEFYHEGAVALVRYAGSDFSEPKAIGAVVQDRAMEIVIRLLVRSLMGDGGAYRVLESLRRALTGQRIEGCTRMRPRREGFVGRLGGVWRFDMSFVTSCPAIEDADTESGPLLKDVRVEGESP